MVKYKGRKRTEMGELYQFMKKGIQRFRPQHKAAFFGTLICGIICHMTVMTHNYLTYDSLWNLYSDQNMISSGRQFLQYFCAPTSYYNLPWLNALVAIFFLSLTAVTVVSLLGIESKPAAFFAGGILATFPAVTGTFSYAYTIDGYMIALFFAALSVYLTKKIRWGFLAGILLLGLSIGVYQSYYSVAILLAVSVLLLDLLNEKAEKKEFIISSLRFAGMGIGAYVFYVLTLKAMLRFSGSTLSGYQGSDRVTGVSLSAIPSGIAASLKDFVKFTFSNGVFTVNIWERIAYYLLLAAAILLFARLVIKKKIYVSAWKTVCTVLLLAVIPIGASLVAVISPDIFFHILMRMPWSVLFVFALALFDKTVRNTEENKPFRVASIAGIVATGCMIGHFILLANVVYLNLEQRYEKTYSLCLRIADRLEQTEGYEAGDPVAIVGGYPNWGKYPPSEITQEVTILFFGAMGDFSTNSAEKYAEFMKHYLNVTISVPTPEEQTEVAETLEFLYMPYFPEANSIKQINGIWIVKTGG